MQYDTHLLRHVRRIIGRNIHSRRCNRNMTLRKLSERCQISESRLDLYELGGDEIGLREMLRIACELDTDLQKLIAD